ncbi:MAG: DUF1987 domain-containing protein [Microscillaceae bacterium]|jgi:sugar phosphate isomerase/epimerase|nr:DUF1987 domain-containing protein [Microscillaceae bacterium]
MHNIIYKETDNTPYVNFDFENGNFEVRGVSYPEYAKEFFQPVVENLDHYIASTAAAHTTMAFKFTYFNTGTNSPITEILRLLEVLAGRNGYTVDIFWYYEDEDEDIRELGEYFQTLTSLPIQILPLEHI